MKSTYSFTISFLLLLVVASAASVSYTHASGVGETEQDCFDTTNKTCITRKITGPPYNAGTDGNSGVSWGCGSCDNINGWYSKLDSSFRDGCLGGNMPDIVGTKLCLETESNGKWDLTFSSFEQKGGGGFAYKRTQIREDRGPVKKRLLMSSRPYYQRYAKDCGIVYTDRIPPQNLRAICREHRANLLLIEATIHEEIEL